MLFERTADEILGEALSELASSTPIDRVSAGAKARAILEVLSRKLNESYKSMDLNIARAFASGATGRYLDLIGELVATPRLGAVAASATVDAKSVRFFVETGTFGNINNASNISISSGTLVGTLEGGTGIQYRVTTTTILPAASSSVYVPVEALIPGEDSNVGAGTLTFHNFTNYADLSNESLLVTNDQGILTGRDLESDVNYRFRITKAVTAAEAANQNAILLAALSVPGVSEVVFFEFARGIGTFDLIIKAVTPTVSDTLVAAVQSAINSVRAQGIVATARKPVETGISFNISVRYTAALPASERQAVEQKIRDGLTTYINGLDIAEEFVINEAVQRVLEVDERIKDIGQPNKPFDEISIYKPSKLEDNKIRSTLLKNYVPAFDERLIIEPSVAVPINISTVS